MPGARQADHEDRLADRARLDLRMTHQRVVHAQAVLEQAEQIAPRERCDRTASAPPRNRAKPASVAAARGSRDRRNPANRCAASPARAGRLRRGSRTAARPSAAPSRCHRTRAARRVVAARRRSPRPPARGPSPAASGPPAPRSTHCAAGAGVTLDSGRAARPAPGGSASPARLQFARLRFAARSPARVDFARLRLAARFAGSGRLRSPAARCALRLRYADSRVRAQSMHSVVPGSARSRGSEIGPPHPSQRESRPWAA